MRRVAMAKGGVTWRPHASGWWGANGACHMLSPLAHCAHKDPRLATSGAAANREHGDAQPGGDEEA